MYIPNKRSYFHFSFEILPLKLLYWRTRTSSFFDNFEDRPQYLISDCSLSNSLLLLWFIIIGIVYPGCFVRVLKIVWWPSASKELSFWVSACVVLFLILAPFPQDVQFHCFVLWLSALLAKITHIVRGPLIPDCPNAKHPSFCDKTELAENFLNTNDPESLFKDCNTHKIHVHWKGTVFHKYL